MLSNGEGMTIFPCFPPPNVAPVKHENKSKVSFVLSLKQISRTLDAEISDYERDVVVNVMV